MELASLNCDMSLACEIKHDDKLTEEDGVYLQVRVLHLHLPCTWSPVPALHLHYLTPGHLYPQAALLYTSVSGQRRLRISNLALNTCDNMGELYRNCDLDTIINFLAKQSISRTMESGPKQVRLMRGSTILTILSTNRPLSGEGGSGVAVRHHSKRLLP